MSIGMETTTEDYRQQSNQTPPDKERRAMPGVSAVQNPPHIPTSSHTTHSTHSQPIHQPNGRVNSQSFNHIEVKLEAIDRIQTQVNLNRASLEANARDLKKTTDHIRHLEEAIQQVSRLHVENMERLNAEVANQLTIFRQQLAATANNVMPSGERLDDQTLEIFSRNLSAVSEKANKVDSMEMDIQLLKRRVFKVEEHVSLSSALPNRENIPSASAHRPSVAVAQAASPSIAQLQHQQHQQHQQKRCDLERCGVEDVGFILCFGYSAMFDTRGLKRYGVNGLEGSIHHTESIRYCHHMCDTFIENSQLTPKIWLAL
ncbi:hypothetical protein BT63DRAFT_13650 [Microthyrium microscopicum]|uniref:Uncharacterized protein n=1 Tax=Microthyrium microscopicum TaxID=703497 RepID=A0A6A6UU29_9PEZI|nr:hypothetical protein BT63DRAFT_13650 [Microthyrium microscopicum]